MDQFGNSMTFWKIFGRALLATTKYSTDWGKIQATTTGGKTHIEAKEKIVMKYLSNTYEEAIYERYYL